MLWNESVSGELLSYLSLMAPISGGSGSFLTAPLTVLTAARRQLARVRDDVTAVGFEAGCVANVGDKIRFIIYNKL